jgi:hypothetical protein
VMLVSIIECGAALPLRKFSSVIHAGVRGVGHIVSGVQVIHESVNIKGLCTGCNNIHLLWHENNSRKITRHAHTGCEQRAAEDNSLVCGVVRILREGKTNIGFFLGVKFRNECCASSSVNYSNYGVSPVR